MAEKEKSEPDCCGGTLRELCYVKILTAQDCIENILYFSYNFTYKTTKKTDNLKKKPQGL